ncbi:hypothetical protein [Actinosynnema sp. NPDC020468]|uniref:hypothetical protein n=1 Tax=Actinosynnema sp. NPDC020468 TaxID=3154488 RepID=UPI0034119125
MSADDESEFIEVEVWWGSYRVPRNSLMGKSLASWDPEADRREQVESGRMTWSLGRLADLLWMLVPESREFIVEAAEDRLGAALRSGSFLLPVGEWSMAVRMNTHLIERQVSAESPDLDLLTRCLGVIRRLIVEDTGDFFWDMFEMEVFSRLGTGEHLRLVERLDPELARVRRAIAARGR